MAHFQDLLQDAEQMTAQIDKENSDMPRLQRTFSQLFDTNRRKLSKTTNLMASDANEINASILLAAKGIDAPKLTSNLENLILQTSISSQVEAPSAKPERWNNIDKIREIDLQSFFKSEKESALMEIIDKTRKQMIMRTEEAFRNIDDTEWEKQKKKAMQELVGSFSNEISLLTKTSSTINPRSSVSLSHSARTSMNDKEIEFAKEIFAYNQKILTKESPKPDLLTNFVNLAKRFNDKNVLEIWNMVYFMTNIPNSDMLVSSTNERDNSTKMQAFFVKQGLLYLEKTFKELIYFTVQTNLKEAKLGGSIGILPVLTAYLRLSQSEKYHSLSEETFDDRQPLWATIYLCLRCGELEAARQVAISTKKDDVASYLDEIIKDSLRNPQSRGQLSKNSQNKIKLEFKSRIKQANDVYKRAVYFYLCRYNGEDDTIKSVQDNVDDFLWFKLNSIALNDHDTSLSTDRKSVV